MTLDQSALLEVLKVVEAMSVTRGATRRQATYQAALEAELTVMVGAARMSVRRPGGPTAAAAVSGLSTPPADTWKS